MRANLARWVAQSDSSRYRQQLITSEGRLAAEEVQVRRGDYYLSLLGELFDGMRGSAPYDVDWARLGNALVEFGVPRQPTAPDDGVSREEALLFAAVSFYSGGYPASAYLTAREAAPAGDASSGMLAASDLLGRPSQMHSEIGRRVATSLAGGDAAEFEALVAESSERVKEALLDGPDSWVWARVVEQVVNRLTTISVRHVLPDGWSQNWTPLVSSFVERRIWEFFPSQIEAIRRGLVERDAPFSLQMPTGSGKTALCETLLYWNAVRYPESAAVLLVPYRSLASELRGSVVRRLNGMGISSRCAYASTVPTGNEVRDLTDARVLVATPEAFGGILGADPSFFGRMSLVICDEGHLLDAADRGIGLELLLSRMMARQGGPPRLVFVSAIVPNVEEINAWLGGGPDAVVRSDYRAADAEYALLRERGGGTDYSVALHMHPHESVETQYTIDRFLTGADFRWINPSTGRGNTYNFRTVKGRAVAAARKSLALGTVALFAANKRGDQGAVGLTEELLRQLSFGLRLPEPSAFAQGRSLVPVVDYLVREYGLGWIGTRALQAGAVLHHGDVPQETREVVEDLLRKQHVRLAICTSTLAEGVNLPIRTIVLYSISRRRGAGPAEDMLARDIRNLVGRAGRAGATTKGLVICANEAQWRLVLPVAMGTEGEAVRGALRTLLERVVNALAVRPRNLTNELLEATPGLHSLVDGIDATLLDLATEEIGEQELLRVAEELADNTFAIRQATLASSRLLLRQVFQLRTQRVLGIRAAGRLTWMKETGSRVRLLDAVEVGLVPGLASWTNIRTPTDPSLVRALFDWAWTQPELQRAIRDAYRLEASAATDHLRETLLAIVVLWVEGQRPVVIGERTGMPMDDLLGVHARVVGFVLQTLVEQAIPLLKNLLIAQGIELPPAVEQFPNHLRFGVPTSAARILASRGLRHRSAAIELGAMMDGWAFNSDELISLPLVEQILLGDEARWRTALGDLVFERTLEDARVQ